MFFGSEQENFESVDRQLDENRDWLRQLCNIHSVINLAPRHVKLLDKKLFNMFL